MKVNFCAVWVGDKYGPEYPAILRDAVLRNCSRLEHDCAWWIITDREDVPAGFNLIPADPRYPGWWAKCQLFSQANPWDLGDRCVYFDLDVCITGRLEDLVEREGIIADWHWPCVNSSVMVWTHGDHAMIWDTLTPERTTRPAGPALAPLLPAGQVNGGDQEHIGEVSDWQTFPPDWFASYRDAHAWPPAGAKAVVMHGSPKPHEITSGWVPNIWRVGGFTSFPEFKGANTTEDQRLANVASAVRRDHLAWFTGFGDEGLSCVIVGGGPSVRDHIADIRWHARQKKTRVVALNNAWRWLVESGVTPFATVLLDARPENAAFLKDAPSSMRLLICSQCHPDVFDAAEATECEIAVWHAAHTDNDRLIEILGPWGWDDGPQCKPTILIPGGSTVGLRTIWLAAHSGFRRIHMFGVDGCYAEDGAHHAYPQALNDGETVLEVAMGEKTYRCAPWHVRQAEEFRWTWADMKEFRVHPDAPITPVTLHVKGRGLVPDIAAALRAAEREAA